MKLFQCLLFLTSLLSFVIATTTNSYILTVDQNDELISSTFLDDIKSLVHDLGGKITHEYSLIKGFTMDASDDVLPRLKKKLQEVESEFGYKVNLERDSEVYCFESHDKSMEKGKLP